MSFCVQMHHFSCVFIEEWNSWVIGEAMIVFSAFYLTPTIKLQLTTSLPYLVLSLFNVSSYGGYIVVNNELSVVLICIFLKTNDARHLLILLRDIWISSIIKWLFESLSILKTGLCVFPQVCGRVLYIF